MFFCFHICVYTPIRHNIMTTYLILCRFPLCSQNSLWGCSVVSGTRVFYSGSSESCMLWGRASMDQTCYSKSYRCSIRLGSGKFGGLVNSLGPFIVFLELFLSSICSVSGHIALWGSHCHQCCCDEAVYLVHNSVWMGGACQVAFTWIPAPKVSQQSIALGWDDQCYSRQIKRHKNVNVTLIIPISDAGIDRAAKSA